MPSMALVTGVLSLGGSHCSSVLCRVRPSRRPPSRAGPEEARILSRASCDKPRSLDDLSGWLPRPAAADRHDSLEPIDDPVFLNPDGQILPALLLVIPHPVTLPIGDELDHDGWNIGFRIRDSAQTGPDHAIRPAPAVGEVDILLRKGLIESRADFVSRLIGPQKVPQFVVWISLRFSWRRAHDQHPMNQLVSVKFIEVGCRVELLGHHEHAVGAATQPSLLRPAYAGGAHGSDLSSISTGEPSSSTVGSPSFYRAAILVHGILRSMRLSKAVKTRPGPIS